MHNEMSDSGSGTKFQSRRFEIDASLTYILNSLVSTQIMFGNLKSFRSVLAAENAIQLLHGKTKVISRKSHVVSYRSAPPPHSKATRIGAVAVGGAMWWWVIWHLWHEPDHITGEFDYPNTSKWSNSHLGIPRDDI